jgi:hypothetical protein
MNSRDLPLVKINTSISDTACMLHPVYLGCFLKTAASQLRYFKVIQGQMIVNFVFSNILVYFLIFEKDYFSESNDVPHVRMHLIVTAKINK